MDNNTKTCKNAVTQISQPIKNKDNKIKAIPKTKAIIAKPFPLCLFFFISFKAINPKMIAMGAEIQNKKYAETAIKKIVVNESYKLFLMLIRRYIFLIGTDLKLILN